MKSTIKTLAFLVTAYCTLLTFNTNAQSGIITTVVGYTTALGFSGDGGQATAALMDGQENITFDAAGNLYIADTYNYRIRMVNTLGIITTIAGTGTAGFSGDGGPATAAELNKPCGVAVDAVGNLYISDLNNNRIRMINTLGIITTIAGNGTAANTGDGAAATAAEINKPQGIAIDAAGNLYIAIYFGSRIRMINTLGIINTIAGNGTVGFSGDGGQATAAELQNPGFVAVDATGNLYIADGSNWRVRMVNTAGIINTVAGNGIYGYSGDGGPATAAEMSIYGIFVDALNNLYIADDDNNRIRMVNTAGIISTIVGNGTIGFSGDGGQATASELHNPYDVAVDVAGNLYINDKGNARIRKVCFNNCSAAGIEQLANTNEQVTIYPNPSTGIFSISIVKEAKQPQIQVYDMLGKKVYETNNTTIDLSSEPNGVYFVTVKTVDNQYTKKLIKN